ncbi:MAG: hypothetical protein DRJ33_04645 [Candidatus Methanomethylicota archaeon]|uniref:Uncharacterized protein n=2 Tax=Thermoproteota archaeon TaxID=2056631 RepID=A0A497EXC1_9CREN|nr:MAG: hypothetical protein DRJ33_04645 [Candidatus Verstraetearchaeota archaeon]
MVSLKTSLAYEAEEVASRSLKIMHSRGSFVTPIRALKAKGVESLEIDERELRGVVEVYASFTLSKLENARQNVIREQTIERGLQSASAKAYDNEAVIVIPNVEAIGPQTSISNPEKIGEYVAELIAIRRADLVFSPMFYRVNEKYILEILDGFLNAASTLSKPVALTIPYVSKQVREEVTEKFLKKSNIYNNLILNFICVDYYGSNPITKYTHHNFALKLSKTLERQINEPVVLYGANIKYSRVIHKYEEIPARDLASPFAGIDIVGPNHRRPIVSRQIAPLLKQEKKIISPTKYTYMAVNKSLRERNTLPELNEGKITASILLKAMENPIKLDRVIEAYNAEKTAIELYNIRNIFKRQENIKQYLYNKHGIKTDQKTREQLEKYHKLISQYRKTMKLS